MSKIWPADATTVVEKAAWVGLKVGVPALYLFMQLSAWGIFKNIYSKNVAAAPAGWHVFGFVLTLGTIIWAWGVVTEKNFVSKNDTRNILVVGAGMVLSLLAYAGFVFNG
jgi:hypothetical protein